MRQANKLTPSSLPLRPICVAAALLVWGTSALAQEAAAPAAAAASAAAAKPDLTVLDTVVTFQRRTERLQSVPVAVTALSGKELAEKQVRRLDDLKFEVPNVTIEQNTATSSGARIFMRGVGTDESLFTADPSVAIYIDDMYVARQTGAMFDMFDLERIEVLRGPQGTLYGRNATGGAIRYVTRKPNGESRLELEARAGNLGRLDLNLSGGGKLGESVAVSYGLMSKSRDGYLRDITNNRDVNNEKMTGGRIGFAFDPTNDTSVRLSIDALRQGSGPTYASGVLDPAKAAQYGRAVNNADGNLYTIETDLPNGINTLDQTGVSFSTSTLFTNVEWRNALTYRQMNNELFVDVDGTPQRRYHLYQNQAQKQGSFETQLTSTGKGPLSWTGGLYLFKEKNRQPTRQDIFTTGGVNTPAQTTQAEALYGQADWRFNPVWKATAGLRFSHESKDFSLASLKADGTPNFNFDGKKSWSRLDWKLGLDAQVNRDWLVYGSATTGFKSGGFNGRATTAAAAPLTLEPETLLTYEAGVKGSLLDGTLNLNANYFQNDYRDLQVTAINPAGIFILLNAASAKIHGLELESNLKVNKAWQVGVNLGTLNSKYANYSAANAVVFDGKNVKQAPKLQYGLNTSYRFPVAGGNLVLGATLRHVGEHEQALNNSPLIRTHAYTLVDARAAFEAAGGKWTLALWSKNLGDTRYITGGFDIAGLGIADAYLNVPRTYGLDLRYRFW